MTKPTITPDVELAHRAGGGIDVSLLWDRFTNDVKVRVFDARSDEGFDLEVDGRSALDAYRHPFAFASRNEAGETTVPVEKAGRHRRLGATDGR